jgi:DNA primase
MDMIKREVTLNMIFSHYGLEIMQQGSEVRMHCPFHDDQHPSFAANLDKGVWQCFGCGLRGDAFTFVIRHDDIETGSQTHNRLAAARYLAETFGVDARSTAGAQVPHGRLPPPTPCERTTPLINQRLTFSLHRLDKRHPYLLHDRGLHPETIDHFGLGVYQGTGIMRGRAVIPIHDAKGELVAYAGRWPGDPSPGQPKYLVPPNFRKSEILFNLHRAREHAGEGLIVVEGYFSVFDLWQRARKNVVAVMGCSVSTSQIEFLVATVGQRGRVLLAFDADDAGRRGMHEAAERLVSHVFVRTVELS